MITTLLYSILLYPNTNLSYYYSIQSNNTLSSRHVYFCHSATRKNARNHPKTLNHFMRSERRKTDDGLSIHLNIKPKNPWPSHLRANSHSFTQKKRHSQRFYKFSATFTPIIRVFRKLVEPCFNYFVNNPKVETRAVFYARMMTLILFALSPTLDRKNGFLPPQKIRPETRDLFLLGVFVFVLYVFCFVLLHIDCSGCCTDDDPLLFLKIPK